MEIKGELEALYKPKKYKFLCICVLDFIFYTESATHSYLEVN